MEKNENIYQIAKDFYENYELNKKAWYKNICIVHDSSKDNQFGSEQYLVVYADPIKEARKQLPRSYKSIYIETRGSK